MTATGVGPEADIVVHEVVEPPLTLRSRLTAGCILVAVGLVCALLLGLPAHGTAGFALSPGSP